MDNQISVVINTLNEEKNIKRAIESVSWADEIIVCDMQSDDDTAVIAKKLGARVVFHRRMGYVEPARNFAIKQSKYPWILILDADETIPSTLGEKIQEVIRDNQVITHIEIPRKNIIFGKWITSSMWWPDAHTRCFKKENVIWKDEIHSKPETKGQGLSLPFEERFAIEHYHYESISQYVERLNRYTTIQSKELLKSGYTFQWKDVIQKPLGEFLSRFFAHQGYKDGVHGLALSFLQAFSHLVMYLKCWEDKGFKEDSIGFDEIKSEMKQSGKEVTYWLKYGNLSKNPVKRFFQRAQNKLS